MSRCKPGQLAMVVRAVRGGECDKAHIGRTVIKITCSSPALVRPECGPVWHFEGPNLRCQINPWCRSSWSGFYDADLQPLDDPTIKDEVDEDVVHVITVGGTGA